jgi:hypothetical protein
LNDSQIFNVGGGKLSIELPPWSGVWID